MFRVQLKNFSHQRLTRNRKKPYGKNLAPHVEGIHDSGLLALLNVLFAYQLSIGRDETIRTAAGQHKTPRLPRFLVRGIHRHQFVALAPIRHRLRDRQQYPPRGLNRRASRSDAELISLNKTTAPRRPLRINIADSCILA